MMMADTTESGDGNGVAVSDAPMEAVESFSFHHIPLTPPSSSSSSPAPREQASNLLHAPPHLSYSATGSRSFNYTQLHSSPFSRSPTTISQPSATEYGFTNTTSITQQSIEANPKSVLSRHSSFQYSAREGWAPPPSPLSRAPVAFPSFSTESPIITSVSSFHNAEDFALQEVVQRQQGSSGMAPPRSRSNKSRWQQVRGRVKFLVAMRRIVTYGNRHTKRLLMLVVLNVAYSTVELLIGLLTGRIGLVSDSFHLTFGCGVLTFSLFAMVVAKRKPDDVYTFGYKRLEVLAAFTNALFLLFLCFSLAVEALHAFVQDESEHKHYLIVSAVTNLAVNLLGVWFFRSYARVRVVYRKAEDMNNHSICLHVISDSIRR
ncbi:hypothetical protein O6H91_10G092700 [Diphasiastrum complanatum]|uniref:Uncharacterized protein n=1 Tax=Diphasiastrum complanatum TaxID=34168 RepID=A0ACC2CKB5_DIPCM|nr:hypothetical protein O6H91_10G092700 [Diphasiastrum complanatum]